MAKRSSILCYFLVLFGFLVLGNSATAQESTKINNWLAHTISTNSPNTLLPLVVRGNRQAIIEFLNQNKGTFRHSAGGYHHITLPVGKVEALAAMDAVAGIQFHYEPGEKLNDQMRINNGVNPVHAGDAPLPFPVTGKGVLMGFIDTGVEINHPDLTDTTTGDTRILHIWDQTESDDPLRIPAQYGYGKLWDSTDINTGICTHLDASGHGSTVTGSAASDGEGGADYKGVAPDVELIIVESDFSNPNWTATIVDAVDYIYATADTYNKPCVINASLGTYFGSHDGRDPAAILIDSLVTAKRGRSFICAAGNAGGLPMHLRHTVTADTSFTWFDVTPAGSSAFGVNAVYFEGWADTADLSNVELSIGADNPVNWSFRGATNFYDVSSLAGSMVTDTIWNNGNMIAEVQLFVAQEDDRYSFEVFLNQPDSSTYLFRLMATGAGAFDVWTTSLLGTADIVGTGLPTALQVPEIIYYQGPDSDQTIVSSWNCSDEVISVGNWTGNTTYVDYAGVTNTVGGTVGLIFPGSSEGPTRDNRTKPDVAATGQIALSTGSFYVINLALTNNAEFLVAPTGLHLRNGGTSMASPVVAGTAALYLELCPDATSAEIKAAILNGAQTDTATGIVPNNTWGMGKTNAFATVSSAVFTPALNFINDTIICVGDSVLFSLGEPYATYQWSNGDAGATIAVQQDDTISVIVTDSSGCVGVSEDYIVVVNPLPTMAVIIQNADTLIATASTGAFQWYLDGVLVPGATDSTYVGQSSGDYTVQVNNGAGCSILSDPYYLSLVGVPEYELAHYTVYPNPTNGHLQLLSGANEEKAVHIQVWNVAGELVFDFDWNQPQRGATVNIDLSNQANGIYTIQVLGQQGVFQQKVIKMQ